MVSISSMPYATRVRAIPPLIWTITKATEADGLCWEVEVQTTSSYKCWRVIFQSTFFFLSLFEVLLGIMGLVEKQGWVFPEDVNAGRLEVGIDSGECECKHELLIFTFQSMWSVCKYELKAVFTGWCHRKWSLWQAGDYIRIADTFRRTTYLM
jgi:hypothetical protein